MNELPFLKCLAELLRILAFSAVERSCWQGQQVQYLNAREQTPKTRRDGEFS